MKQCIITHADPTKSSTKCGTISDFKEKSINECKRKDVKLR